MPNNAKISFVGNLVREPVTRQAGASTVVSFTVAVNTMNKAPDGSYASDFYDVSVWGKNGEYLMEKVQKGTQVWVTGDFSTSEYAAQDGTKRTALRVNATDVRPLSRLKGEAAGGGAPRGRAAYAPPQQANTYPF